MMKMHDTSDSGSRWQVITDDIREGFDQLDDADDDLDADGDFNLKGWWKCIKPQTQDQDDRLSPMISGRHLIKLMILMLNKMLMMILILNFKLKDDENA